MTDTKEQIAEIAHLLRVADQPASDAPLRSAASNALTAQAARIDALEAALRGVVNSFRNRLINMDKALEAADTALNDKTPTDTGPAGE